MYSDLPNECQMMRASSGTCSRFLLSSIKACSLELPLRSSETHVTRRLCSSFMLPSENIDAVLPRSEFKLWFPLC